MPRSRADALSEALRILEGTHGKIAIVRRESPMDFIMGLLLSRNSSPERAMDAVKRLAEEFVDWNEVRISYQREVANVLATLGYEDPEKRAEAMLAFLGRLYKDKNGVDLAFLRGMEPEAVFSWLRGYPHIGDAVASALVAFLTENGIILDVPELVRTAQRIGFGVSDATPARIRKMLEEIAQGEDRLMVHYYLPLHAAGPCRARAPLCAECALNACCDYGRASLKAAGMRAAAKKSAKEEGPDEEKEAGSAKRAGAKKDAGGTVKAPKKKCEKCGPSTPIVVKAGRKG